MILQGQYKNKFWIGSVIIGNLVPLFIIYFMNDNLSAGLAGALILIGMYITEKIWIEAPQRIPLA